MERRTSLEVRAKGRRLEGLAATFGTEARIGNFVEVIAQGAFAASIAEGRDILALADHDPAKLLGRTRSKTLQLEETSAGLAFTIQVPRTSLGDDVLELAERGDLGGMSFGFRVPKGGERWQGRRRTLERVDLAEISVVSSWPAYPATTVHARSKTPALELARRFLESLR